MIYVIGDIHGCYKALIELLRKVNFDYQNDTLIVLGDVFDGWSDVCECIEILMSIDNLIYVKGNHDVWAIKYLKLYLSGDYDVLDNDLVSKINKWVKKGGMGTIDSYTDGNNINLVDKHIDFISNMPEYHIDEHNNLFIHAGYRDIVPEKDKNLSCFDFLWDDYYAYVEVIRNRKVDSIFNHVYLGHTSTPDFKRENVVTINNVTFMDGGVSRKGKLCIKNLTNGEVTTSELTGWEYYPDYKGRNKTSFNNYI